MNSYVAFLRGINVGGHRKIPMAELRQAMTELPFTNISTYIQSGNLFFRTKIGSPRILEGLLRELIQREFGYEVPVLVKAIDDIQAILKDNPFWPEQDRDAKGIYFVFLFAPPEEKDVVALCQESFDHERFKVTRNCVYLYCAKGYGKARLTNNLIEKRLHIKATTRNLRTVQKMLALGGKGDLA